jgi:hypothetical protein
MSTMARVALGLVLGYALGAVVGFGAVHAVSSNVHDKDLEAVMTAAFASGPLGAALGVAMALWFSRTR